jgi:hypothetical protein
MAIKIQVRRGTAANWTSTNPTLAAGEVAFETDTGKIKVGTGSTAWTSLAYAAMTPTQVTTAVAGGVTTANAYTDSTANANLALHEGDTTTHGVTGYIVGTTDAQTLTNKTMGDTLLMNNNQISGLGTPTQSTHAATKAYVDSLSESLNVHDAVKVATTANITISTALVAGQVIDGVTLASTNRVLVKNQTTTSQNGIYTVQASGAAVRASDYNSVPEIETGDFVFVTSGTVNASTGWTQTAVVTTLDTDPITFTQFSGSGTYIAGNGLALTGNSFAIDAAVVPTITSTNNAVAQGLLDAKAYTDAEIIEHNVNANVHGIADFTLLATTVSPTFTGTVVLPSTTSIGNVSSTEIDVLNGLTASTAELNILDGVTSSTAELNILDGVTSTAAELNILDGVTSSTSELNLLDGVTASTIELNYVDGVTSSIQTQLNDKAPIASPTFTGTVSGVTKSHVGLGNVNNTADADKPVSTATQTALDAKAPLASPTFTGTVSGITKTHVGLGNVDNTTDAGKPVSTATQTALDLKANLDGPTFTGTVVLPSTTSIGNVTAAEIGYVDGVTSAIQTQLNDKLALGGGTLTGALTLSGAPTVDLHAATKLYVDNVVSGINFHLPVRVATTANITLSGAQTIDGVSVVAGDRVLVKDQTDAKTNGIYVASASTWSRATDADNNPTGELAGGDFCLVLEGTVSSGYGYVCSNTSAVTLGVTNVTYVPFNAAKAVAAGNGLQEATPGTLSIDTTITQTRVSGVSDTEIGYLDGVTSAIQTQINNKQDTVTGAATTITGSDLTASRALTSNGSGKVAVSAVTATELGYVSGVTSAIQTQLGAKANTSGPTFVGTVTVAAQGIAFTDATQTKAGVPSISTFVTKTSSYTMGADSGTAERDIIVLADSASSMTISIPTDATTNFPIGTSFDVIRLNTGALNIAAVTSGTTSVVATPGLNFRARYSSATCLKIAANSWIVYGDLAS